MSESPNSVGSDEFFDAIDEQRSSPVGEEGVIFPRLLPPPSRLRGGNSPSASPRRAREMESPADPAAGSSSAAGVRLSLLSKVPDSQPIHSIPASPGGKRLTEKASHRRRHLESLRRRMQEEQEEGFDEPTASSDSEKEYHTLLGENYLRGSQGGLLGAEPLSAREAKPGTRMSRIGRTERVKKSSTLPTDASGSSGGFGNKSSAGGYSTGSSKSGTMDRYETPESSASKSSSLERTYRQSSLYASSSSKLQSSLSREISLSGGETSLLGLENPDLAAFNRRKNSEAAELINQLTSQLVTTSNSVLSSTPKELSTHRPSSLELSQLTPKASQVGEARANTSGTVKNGNFQPDLITSTVKFPYSESGSRTATLPVAPPRRRKPGDQPMGMNRDDSVSITSLPTHSRSNIPHKASVGKERKSGSGTTLPRQQSSSLGPADTSCMDPISIEGARRMSLHPRNRNQSGMSGGDTDSTGSTRSDMASIRSMPMMEQSGSFRSFTKLYGARFSKRVGKTVLAASHKMRNVAGEVTERFTGDAESTEEEDIDDSASEAGRAVRVRAKHQKKGPYDFEQLRQVQEIGGEHSGAVWCLKFSQCGRLLASAGQDNVMRVWVLRDAYKCFNDMRQKYNIEAQKKPNMAGNSLDPFVQLAEAAMGGGSAEVDSVSVSDDCGGEAESVEESADDIYGPFVKKPFCIYRGHNADILDLAWSKNFFLLSSSMDRTVRLWHISRTECLCCFQHIDFVTSIAFLPKDDKFFLSGSLDGKLRVWNITEKKVALWNEVEGNRLITALAFVNNGKFAVAGTFDGKCVFYSTDQLKYHTMIDVKSSRGKNSKGHKVTGLSVYQDKARGDKLLVTSNDSRVRLYDLTNLSLTCKYKGVSNYSSQIRAAFSPDGTHIVCGSEDKFIYVWRTSLDSMTLSVRKDRNGMWERIRAQAHNDVVTAAIFAPKPELFFQLFEKAKSKMGQSGETIPGTPLASLKPSGSKSKARSGDVIVTADFSGKICVFSNRAKLKAGGSEFFGL